MVRSPVRRRLHMQSYLLTSYSLRQRETLVRSYFWLQLSVLLCTAFFFILLYPSSLSVCYCSVPEDDFLLSKPFYVFLVSSFFVVHWSVRSLSSFFTFNSRHHAVTRLFSCIYIFPFIFHRNQPTLQITVDAAERPNAPSSLCLGDFHSLPAVVPFTRL